ncbi:MAG TPA: PAS domain S-box protein [Gemmatimonadales bacterium]|nr:PAS domain S-box protein [Gemmatimonadales bacterium]
MSAHRFRVLRAHDRAPEDELSRTEQQLRTTARQQEAVAHLGQQALAGMALPELEQAAVALAARVLEIEFATVFEFRAESRTLVLRAGVGWPPESVDRTVLPADADSYGSYVLRSPGAVVVEDLASDPRFGSAALLVAHGIVSSLSVVIPGAPRAVGILGVHAAERREFTIHDTHFLQAVANVLATAIARARSEAALRRSEEHFRSLIENASDIVTIVGENGVFRYASPAVERVLGYPPSELLERNTFDFVHPDDIAVVGEALSRALHRPARPQTAQFRFRARDGSWRVLEAVGQARATESGAAQLIVNARDVTERRRQERALRESKERLRTVIAGAPLVLFALDREGVFTLVEGKGLDAVGVRPAQLVGRAAAELYAEVPQALADVRRALAGETFSSTVEVYGVVFDVWYTPIRDGAGQVTGVIGVANDITERRRAVEALRRSEESNRALVQHATHGIYRSSPAGRFLAVNPALVKMLGYESEAQLLGVDLAADVYADAAERERILAAFRGGEVVESAEVTWKRRDGKRVLMRLSGRAVRRADGGIECFETIAEDITERRALEEQLRQSQKMEAVGQLTGGIAHDFNNLLTIILANAQLVARALPPERAEAHADLRDVVSAALRGRAMVKELLGFARRTSLDLVPVELGDLVADLHGFLRRILPADVEIVMCRDAELPEVRADVPAVEQIVLNLATNARDAMPDGGVLRIETRRATLDEERRRACGAPHAGEYVCLALGDTGCGMDAATQQRMFEPFFTTKPLGQGTGLGLATVHGLVRQHGGGIEVQSEPGKGTRFHIYFPVAAGARTETSDAAPPGGDAHGGSETILVVEDDDPLRRAAKRILEEAGYQVLSAADGLEALDVLRQGAVVHLVFSDLVMPRLGGRALYDAARRAGQAVPFLFASGYSDPDSRGSAAAELPAPLLHKPWSGPDLLARVRALLDRR